MLYNFFGILREHTDISEKEILEISKKFKEGHTGAMLLNLGMKRIIILFMKNQAFRTGYFWDLSRQISSMPV